MKEKNKRTQSIRTQTNKQKLSVVSVVVDQKRERIYQEYILFTFWWCFFWLSYDDGVAFLDVRVRVCCFHLFGSFLLGDGCLRVCKKEFSI